MARRWSCVAGLALAAGLLAGGPAQGLTIRLVVSPETVGPLDRIRVRVRVQDVGTGPTDAVAVLALTLAFPASGGAGGVFLTEAFGGAGQVDAEAHIGRGFLQMSIVSRLDAATLAERQPDSFGAFFFDYGTGFTPEDPIVFEAISVYAAGPDGVPLDVAPIEPVVVRVVPEPAPLGLLLASALGVAVRRRPRPSAPPLDERPPSGT